MPACALGYHMLSFSTGLNGSFRLRLILCKAVLGIIRCIVGGRIVLFSTFKSLSGIRHKKQQELRPPGIQRGLPPAFGDCWRYQACTFSVCCLSIKKLYHNAGKKATALRKMTKSGRDVGGYAAVILAVVSGMTVLSAGSGSST